MEMTAVGDSRCKKITTSSRVQEITIAEGYLESSRELYKVVGGDEMRVDRQASFQRSATVWRQIQTQPEPLARYFFIRSAESTFV